METKLHLAEKDPGVHIEKLNMRHQCALAGIKAKRAAIRKSNWNMAKSDYSFVFGTCEISSRIAISSELQTMTKTLTNRNKPREGQPRCLGG